MSFFLLAQVHGKFSLPQISDGERVKAETHCHTFQRKGFKKYKCVLKIITNISFENFYVIVFIFPCTHI